MHFAPEDTRALLAEARGPDAWLTNWLLTRCAQTTFWNRFHTSHMVLGGYCAVHAVSVSVSAPCILPLYEHL